MNIGRPLVSAVLWDIDGTLVTSGGVAAAAFLDAVADITGRRPQGRGLDLGGRIDPEIAGTLLQSVGAGHELIAEVLARHHINATARSDEFKAKVRPLPGATDILALLQTAGIRQTVVTGNIESVARMKLLAAQLIPPIEPDVGGFGDSGVNRVEVASAALEKLSASGWRGSPQDCWIVGDTPRDLLCAQALGLPCALVATGRHSLESLTALGADLVIAGLDAPGQLLARWNLR